MQNIYCKIAEYLLKFPSALLVNAVIRRLLKRIDSTTIKSRYGFYIHFQGANAVDRDVVLGEYEKEYLALAARLLSQGDFVIDVGAYEGQTSLFFSKAVGYTGRVFAIEPNIENLLALHGNIELNSAYNIQVIPKAISNTISILPFYCKTGQGTYSSLSHYPHLKAVPTMVSCDTLDNLFCGKEYADRIKLIKLDIEGGEADAISGAAMLIKAHKPYVAFEADMTCWAFLEHSMEYLFNTVQNMGYEIYIARAENGLVPYNLAPRDLFRQRILNFIGIPKSRGLVDVKDIVHTE